MARTLIFLLSALISALAFALVAHADPVAYITDVEGKMAKLEAFFRDNPHVFRDGSGQVQIRPGSLFVFGGDSVDHGPGNLEVVDTLVDLKRRFPDRVVLIAGNREINKIQIPAMLSPEAMATVPEDLKGQENTRANRLKWLLGRRMNAARSFENHRVEIASRRGVPVTSVADDEVLDVIERGLQPGGKFRELLSKSQLAFVHEGTLYVHGALTEANIQSVPGLRTGSAKRLKAEDWASRLNDWYRSQLRLWERAPVPAVGTGTHPAESLLAYQRWRPGTRANQESVVYARYSDESGNPRLPGKKVADWLKRSGLYRVVSGHTPSGDTPTILRGHGVEFLVGDNTYAEHASQVFVDGESVRIRSLAQLAGGETRVLDQSWKLGDATPLGLRLPGSDFLVKGRFDDGSWLLFRTLPDFSVEQAAIGEDELFRKLGMGPAALSGARMRSPAPECETGFAGLPAQ